MSAKGKVFAGVILLIPAVALGLMMLMARFDNPAMTETQLFLSFGWMQGLAMIFALPGAILVRAGFDEYSEPE